MVTKFEKSGIDIDGSTASQSKPPKGGFEQKTLNLKLVSWF